MAVTQKQPNLVLKYFPPSRAYTNIFSQPDKAISTMISFEKESTFLHPTSVFYRVSTLSAPFMSEVFETICYFFMGCVSSDNS